MRHIECKAYDKAYASAATHASDIAEFAEAKTLYSIAKLSNILALTESSTECKSEANILPFAVVSCEADKQLAILHAQEKIMEYAPR